MSIVPNQSIEYIGVNRTEACSNSDESKQTKGGVEFKKKSKTRLQQNLIMRSDPNREKNDESMEGNWFI